MPEGPGATRLRRGSDRMVAGVCSGLAHYFQVDPLWIRLAFVALTFAGGAGIILYLILWVLMPPAGTGALDSRGLAHEHVRSIASEVQGMGEELRRMGDEIRQTFHRSEAPPPAEPSAGGPAPAVPPPVGLSAGGPAPAVPPPAGTPPPLQRRRGVWVGVILIGIGGVILLNNLGLFYWNWHLVWPFVLIAIGVLILAQRLR